MSTPLVAEEAPVDSLSRKEYRITISPVTPDALPDLATAELLAFAGVDQNSSFIPLISPLRPALFRSGVHPRYWPEYHHTIRTREQNLREGKIVLMATAEELDAEGKSVASNGAVPVAMARIKPPHRIHQELLARRTLSSRLLGDYVLPTVSKVKEKLLGGEADGVDKAFLAIFKGEMERVRTELVGEEDWILELLLVHPAYQRSGVGGALVRHCLALADAANPLAVQYPIVSEPPSHKHTTSSSQAPSGNEPAAHEDNSLPDPPASEMKSKSRPVQVFLESSPAGEPLYARYGFHTVYVSEIVYRGEAVSWPVMVCERGV